MTRMFPVCVVFLFLAATAGAADLQTSELAYSARDLVRTHFAASQVSFDIYAGGLVDTGSLIREVNLAKNETPDSIYAKINNQRRKFYPDREIILTVTRPAAASGLVKSLYWWNNANCATCSWYAQYTSRYAVMFIDDVKYGAYNVYDRAGSNWIFRNRTNTGSAFARSNYGSLVLRGFKGASAGVSSKADVVMYFFN